MSAVREVIIPVADMMNSEKENVYLKHQEEMKSRADKGRTLAIELQALIEGHARWVEDTETAATNGMFSEEQADKCREDAIKFNARISALYNQMGSIIPQ